MNADRPHPIPAPLRGRGDRLIDASGLPLVVRILPGRRHLRTGLAFGLSLAALFSGLLAWMPDAARALPRALHWAGVGAGLGIAATCVVKLVAQLPVIEVSELGIAIWFLGPYRGPFFAPWSRVSSVGLTRVECPGPLGRRPVDALAIRIVEDGGFRFPALPADLTVPIRGAPGAELAWPDGAIAGRLQTWVTLMKSLKSAHDSAHVAQPASRPT
jgi:hypothetical protein